MCNDDFTNNDDLCSLNHQFPCSFAYSTCPPLNRQVGLSNLSYMWQAKTNIALYSTAQAEKTHQLLHKKLILNN